jgi:hypothetical protein
MVSYLLLSKEILGEDGIFNVLNFLTVNKVLHKNAEWYLPMIQ